MAIEILKTLNIGNEECILTTTSFIDNEIINHYSSAEWYPDQNEIDNVIYGCNWNKNKLYRKKTWDGWISAPTYTTFALSSSTIGFGSNYESNAKFYWSAGGGNVPSIQDYYDILICIPVFAIDTTNQTGRAFYVLAYKYGARKGFTIFGSGSSSAEKYTLLTGAIPATYNWQSVASLNTKQGSYKFTYIDSEAIEDADNQTVSRNDVLYVSTKITDFLAGIPSGNVNNILETADGYRLVAKRDSTNGDYYIGFKVGDTLEWYDTISTLLAPITSIGFVIDHENQVGKYFKAYESSVGGSIVYQVLYSPVSSVSGFDDIMADMYTFLTAGIEEESPDEIDDDPSDGTINPWVDIAITGLDSPTKSAQDTGFVTLYEIGNQALQLLSGYMWSTSFLDFLHKFMNDPKDVVIGLMVMPVTPDVDGTPVRVNAGNVFTDITANKLSDSFKIITLGTLKFKKQFKDFCDYAPYTKATAFLPFVGSHELNVSDVVGKTLTLKYQFDFFSGTCVAEIDVDGKPRYFFAGNAGYNIPISSGDYSRLYSGAIAAGATLGTSLSTYAAGGTVGSSEIAAEAMATSRAKGVGLGINTAAQTLNAVMGMKPNVQYSSGGGSSAGIISDQTAYVVIESPKRKKDSLQDSFLGRTSMIATNLGDVSGYTKCMKVHLDSISCYDKEREEIENYLMSGVRFETGTATPTYTPSQLGNVGIYLMKLQSDKDIVGKTWTDQVLVEGELFYDQSVMTPKVKFTGNYISYTYAYIPLFERFYYIEDVQPSKNNITIVSMRVDVLQSFATAIKNCDALLDRQESLYSKELDDKYYWSEQQTNVYTVPFLKENGDEAKFARTSSSYILIMAGPGGDVPPEEPAQGEE